jgi:hypothetical protein
MLGSLTILPFPTSAERTEERAEAVAVTASELASELAPGLSDAPPQIPKAGKKAAPKTQPHTILKRPKTVPASIAETNELGPMLPISDAVPESVAEAAEPTEPVLQQPYQPYVPRTDDLCCSPEMTIFTCVTIVALVVSISLVLNSALRNS